MFVEGGGNIKKGFSGTVYELLPYAFTEHEDLINRTHSKIKNLHPRMSFPDTDIATMVSEVLNDEDLLEYQKKFGDMLDEYRLDLMAPIYLGLVAPSLLLFSNDTDTLIQTLSESKLYMNCLEIMPDTFKCSLMSSLSIAQTLIPAEDKVTFFETCAKGGILKQLINVDDIVGVEDMINQTENMLLEPMEIDIEALLSSSDEPDVEDQELDSSDSNEIETEDRFSLIMFLGESFEGADEAAIKNTLETTGALDFLEWKDDIEEWTNGNKSPIAKALLSVCHENRDTYLTKKNAPFEDKPDAPQA